VVPKQDAEMLATIVRSPIVKWIAAVLAAAICAFFAVVLIRKVQAVLAQVKDQITQKRTKVHDTVTLAEDMSAQELGELKADISRVQHQLHVPDFPVPGHVHTK
jgi:hypothetical protein